MKIAYKLAIKKRDYYTSYIVSGQALTIYEVGQRTTIPAWLYELGRYPMLFSDVESMWDFACIVDASKSTDIDNVYVLTCECDEEVDIPEMCDIQKLTYGVAQIRSYPSVPYGTVSYKNVIPVRADHISDFILAQGAETEIDAEAVFLVYNRNEMIWKLVTN